MRKGAFLVNMPVIKSAIKKLRKDVKRTKANDAERRKLDIALRKAKKSKSGKDISSAVSLVDRAVKNNLMHKNKAARVKSSLSKLAKPIVKAAKTAVKKTPAKTVKASAKKTVKKSK